MLNTYGLRAINTTTFIRVPATLPTEKAEVRDSIKTFLRVHNLVLNILGYIPVVSTVSGTIRIMTGLAIIGVTYKIRKGNRTGSWYREGLQTGAAQVARGVAEAFVPFGKVINAILDAVSTPFNMRADRLARHPRYNSAPEEDILREVAYPHVFKVLHLV